MKTKVVNWEFKLRDFPKMCQKKKKIEVPSFTKLGGMKYRIRH